jgi:hypothetical protein
VNFVRSGVIIMLMISLYFQLIVGMETPFGLLSKSENRNYHYFLEQCDAKRFGPQVETDVVCRLYSSL